MLVRRRHHSPLPSRSAPEPPHRDRLGWDVDPPDRDPRLTRQYLVSCHNGQSAIRNTDELQHVSAPQRRAAVQGTAVFVRYQPKASSAKNLDSGLVSNTLPHGLRRLPKVCASVIPMRCRPRFWPCCHPPLPDRRGEQMLRHAVHEVAANQTTVRKSLRRGGHIGARPGRVGSHPVDFHAALMGKRVKGSQCLKDSRRYLAPHQRRFLRLSFRSVRLAVIVGRFRTTAIRGKPS